MQAGLDWRGSKAVRFRMTIISNPLVLSDFYGLPKGSQDAQALHLPQQVCAMCIAGLRRLYGELTPARHLEVSAYGFGSALLDDLEHGRVRLTTPLLRHIASCLDLPFGAFLTAL